METTFTPGTGGFGGAGVGGSGAGSSTTVASSSAASTTSSQVSSSAEASSSSSSTGGPLCDYDAPNICTSAVEIPGVDGDTGTDVRVVKGTTSKWFKVKVLEGSDFINDMSFIVALESPPGMIYSLFVYPGTAAGPDCLVSPTTALGDPPAYSESWSDTIGSDDARWYGLEVRYGAGDLCGPAAEWKLTVAGNTAP